MSSCITFYIPRQRICAVAEIIFDIDNKVVGLRYVVKEMKKIIMTANLEGAYFV